MFKEIIAGFNNLVYPQNCLICKNQISADSKEGLLCLKCKNGIKINIPPFCPKCSRHLDDIPLVPKCKTCTTNNPEFDFAWGACFYNESLKELIHRFKYNNKTLLKNYLAKLIITFIEAYNLDVYQFDMIMPIPLFSSKLRERGYNQSLLLASLVADKFSIELSSKNLKRSKNTKSQTLLSKKERWTNTAGAFKIKNPTKIINKNILLIDDLLTTGATSSHAAKILKDSGANTVGVLTLAIAT